MSVRSADKFKRHGCRAFSGIEITARSTRAASASERSNHHMTAIIAGIKGISTLEVAAVNHFIDILNNGITNFNTGIIKLMKMV